MSHRFFLLLVLILPGQAHADDVADKAFGRAIKATGWVIGKRVAGSGCLVEGKYRLMLTNYHIVLEDTKVAVIFPDYDGKTLRKDRDYYHKNRAKLAIAAKVIYRDKTRDLALIQLERLPETVKPLDISHVLPEVGDRVFRLGSPATEGQCWHMNEGTVSDLAQATLKYESRQQVIAMAIYSSLPATNGHSGAAVLNKYGELVAIHAAKEHLHDRSISIDVNDVREFLKAGESKLIQK